MHITGLDILTADVGSPGAPRVYVFVRVQTDEGISGIGEPSCVGKEQAVVGAVRDLEHLVLGADPLSIERLLGVKTRTVIWRTGPVLSAAVSGIEHALWDIKSKALGVPVWQLLGGRVRDRIECYAWIHGGEPGRLPVEGIQFDDGHLQGVCQSRRQCALSRAGGTDDMQALANRWGHGLQTHGSRWNTGKPSGAGLHA